MIESIEIARISTYGTTPAVLCDLSKFNFLFGFNGSGKTSIARVIAEEEQFPTCSVSWRGGTRLETMVYSRDFIEQNFSPSTELKGIFTLGEENVDTIEKIAAAKAAVDVLTAKIEGLQLTLHGEDGAGGKRGELLALETDLRETCWAQKQKHDLQFSGAFSGLRNNAEKFKVRVLKERGSNAAELASLEDLEKKAATVFGPTPTVESLIPDPDMDRVVAHESDPLLRRRVIGKEDVDIAEMITRLSNSDWVREGRPYFDANDGTCPFCQQATPEAFATSLSDYFDETFERDSKAIQELEASYKADSERLQQDLDRILATPPRFLDVQKLEDQKALLDSRITVNLLRLSTKRKEPSKSIDLESLSDVLSATRAHIRAANALIAEHNRRVSNLAQEQQALTAQVWKYLIEVEIKEDLSAYDTKCGALKKAIESIAAKIESSENDLATKVAEIRRLEKDTTSSQPTIDGINTLLVSFGFQSFSLAKAETDRYYKLVRADGSDAKETLSEGERSFVTFLYFYHLLKGSDSESGMTTNRVVVFDDPVSSLDSDILFIVSSLIKGLFDEVRDGSGHIKQVFVLTHNVYFHREVTFNPRRGKEAQNEETFWTVRKSGVGSTVEGHQSNPIKSSYDLLWAEVRNPDGSSLTIQNTLRRILESYFKMFGGIDPKDFVDKFQGKEKLICKSLFAWVNAGSHFADEDLYVSTGGTGVESFLTVFREVFKKSGHLPHYRMMMGDAYLEEEADASPG
jgi:wobble nucleotide-excising tRNase